MTGSMAGAARKYLLLLLKLAVATALTGLLLHYASPSRIIFALRSADIRLVLTFIPLILVSMTIAALQLKILTDCHAMNLGLMRIIAINAATEFYNLFLPGIISGGAIRWYLLSRENRMRAQALAVIAMNRLLSLAALLAVGVLGWLLEGNNAETEFVFWFLAACLLALAGWFLLCSNRQLGALVRRSLVANESLPPFIKEKLLKLLDAANEYRKIRLRDRLQLGLYATTWHVAVLASTYLFCLALGVSVPMSALAWIRAVVTLALLLPVTISGFGLREGSWIYFLGFYGVAPSEAFALSLLTFVRTLFQAVIGFALMIRTLFHTTNA